MNRCGVFVVCLLGLVCAPFALAQDYRGQVTGKILDPSGAAIPSARVTVTNTATNTISTTTSDSEGNYNVLYLAPSTYVITVEARGFKKLNRSGIEVRVGDNIRLDLSLEVGAAQETVTVTAEAPLLEANSASMGQVIDQRRIVDLPLSDGNPFILHRLVPGVIYYGDLKFSRPFDNGGTSDVRIDGSPGRNEFTLDGAPNMASGGRVAFVPPRDVVEEFKVETASFDAQDGHTAAGSVNVALKSGTNALHGSLYEFFRNDKLAANDFFLNRSGRPRDSLRYHLYGGSVGGPILLPKIYNGRNKTFFFFGFEGIKDRFPEPSQRTVPTDAQRSGDLSALLALGSSYQIYNPYSATSSGGIISRQPISENKIPANMLSQIAQNYLKLYPRPNQTGDAQGRQNFISPNTRGDDFDSETGRLDHQLTDKQRMFFRYARNNRREFRGNWSGVTENVRATGNYLFRINHAANFDHVYTLSPTTILNYRVGFSRFEEPSIRQHEGIFDPATLGFNAGTVALFQGYKLVPRFEIGGFDVLGDTIGGGTRHNIYSFQPVMTKIMGSGRHQVKFGYDWRSYRENSFGPGHAAGRYDFDTTYTRAASNSSSATIGQQLAAFLIGQPTGGILPRNASRANQSLFNAFLIQDDWKVNNRLTLNLGIRYEHEGATSERFDRNTRGFDFTVASPIEAAVRSAYAANPIPQIAAADFKVKGGLLFAGPDGHAFWNADSNNWQPRLGLAYRLRDKTVLRTGWGVYTVPFVIAGSNQPGFSQDTSLRPTNDAGLTFVANLANPFPNGVLEPRGSADGLMTFVGRGITANAVDGVANGQAQRWQVGVQHELPGLWLVEASYVGNRGYDLTVGTNYLNSVPKQYLSTSPERDNANNTLLTQNVTNPFRGLAPAGTGLGDSTTVGRSQLLRPFPHFTSIGTNVFYGDSDYHSFQLRVEKRFSKGYTVLVAYTASRFMERSSFLNESDTVLEERLNNADRPQRLVISGVWELPFGKGKALGSNWHPAVNHILGGWQISGIAQFQNGEPLNFDNNYLFRGDINTIKLSKDQQSIDRWFDTSGADNTAGTNCAAHTSILGWEKLSSCTLVNNYRTAPRQIAGIRGPWLHLWDLSVIKVFSITEQVRLQLRGEAINAFNHPQFAAPNRTPTDSTFGRITGQNNLPRNIQVALRLTF